jgi:hypothetical protein
MIMATGVDYAVSIMHVASLLQGMSEEALAEYKTWLSDIDEEINTLLDHLNGL